MVSSEVYPTSEPIIVIALHLPEAWVTGISGHLRVN
jgi:hypothetical protein